MHISEKDALHYLGLLLFSYFLPETEKSLVKWRHATFPWVHQYSLITSLTFYGHCPRSSEYIWRESLPAMFLMFCTQSLSVDDTAGKLFSHVSTCADSFVEKIRITCYCWWHYLKNTVNLGTFYNNYSSLCRFFFFGFPLGCTWYIHSSNVSFSSTHLVSRYTREKNTETVLLIYLFA